MARYYRIRPSTLLKGSWADLNIDVAFGLAAVIKADAELKAALQTKGMGAGIASAVHLATKAVP